MTKRLRREGGFSLIELMVALLLGLIVVGGIISVLLASRKSYQLQQGNNFNQQSLRFAVSQLDWSIRMADFWGGVKRSNVSGSPSTAGLGGSGDCDAAWVLADQGIYGYSGGTTFPLSGCVDDANYVKGSDVMVVRYGDTHGYSPSTSGSTGTPYTSTTIDNRTSLFVVTGVGQQGYLFRSGETPPDSPLGVNVGRYVYPYQLDMYYLRPCSDPGTDGKCGTADDGDAADRTPTLVRMHLDSTGALTSEAIVDGVEQMQFEYAVNVGSDSYQAGAFVSASDLNDTTWKNVIAVRASIVARSKTRDVSVPNTGDFQVSAHCRYQIASNGALTFPTLTGGNACEDTQVSVFGDHPQQYTRTVSSNVIQIRNRVRG
ncbi:PilW family protein [Dyella sp. KULCS107]|uniref:PilW family protein n=1 Tax=Dyella sp. KULCS107 TaxID=3422216 RepID=UPI003D6DC832